MTGLELQADRIIITLDQSKWCKHLISFGEEKGIPVWHDLCLINNQKRKPKIFQLSLHMVKRTVIFTESHPQCYLHWPLHISLKENNFSRSLDGSGYSANQINKSFGTARFLLVNTTWNIQFSPLPFLINQCPAQWGDTFHLNGSICKSFFFPVIILCIFHSFDKILLTCSLWTFLLLERALKAGFRATAAWVLDMNCALGIWPAGQDNGSSFIFLFQGWAFSQWRRNSRLADETPLVGRRCLNSYLSHELSWFSWWFERLP